MRVVKVEGVRLEGKSVVSIRVQKVEGLYGYDMMWDLGLGYWCQVKRVYTKGVHKLRGLEIKEGGVWREVDIGMVPEDGVEYEELDVKSYLCGEESIKQDILGLTVVRERGLRQLLSMSREMSEKKYGVLDTIDLRGICECFDFKMWLCLPPSNLVVVDSELVGFPELEVGESIEFTLWYCYESGVSTLLVYDKEGYMVGRYEYSRTVISDVELKRVL